MHTSLNILNAVWTIPLYTCSPVTWNAKRARMVSRGYVSVTAVTPAPEPAKNLPMCELLPNSEVSI